MPSHRSIAAVLLCTSLLAASADPTHADAVNDGGFWLNIISQGDLGPEPQRHRIKWWLDGQLRLYGDSGGFGQGLVRPGVGYALTDSTSVWLGYAYIRTDPVTGPPNNEQRIWQQFSWGRHFDKVAFDWRSRLEERWLDSTPTTATGDEVGVRFRQLVGGRMSLDFAPRITPVIWNEVFFNLNDTDWGAQSGFDQNRLFVGLGFKFTPDSRLRVDAGYMNQYIERPTSAQNLSNNLFSLTLQWNFGSEARPAASVAPASHGVAIPGDG